MRLKELEAKILSPTSVNMFFFVPPFQKLEIFMYFLHFSESSWKHLYLESAVG